MNLQLYCLYDAHTHTHTHLHTHLESIYTIWNYLIKGIPDTISRNNGELSKLNKHK